MDGNFRAREIQIDESRRSYRVLRFSDGRFKVYGTYYVSGAGPVTALIDNDGPIGKRAIKLFKEQNPYA